ncbi:MAG: lytic transglycosylase domain-containing protein [Patescibacteria group bacterium]
MALVDQVALQYGVNPNLARVLVNYESGGQAGAISPAGARGIMQVMPSTASAYGYTAQDLLDPVKNIDAGMHYFSDMQRQFNYDGKLALAAYHAGPGAVINARGIPNTHDANVSTEQYVNTVWDQYLEQNRLRPTLPTRTSPPSTVATPVAVRQAQGLPVSQPLGLQTPTPTTTQGASWQYLTSQRTPEPTPAEIKLSMGLGPISDAEAMRVYRERGGNQQFVQGIGGGQSPREQGITDIHIGMRQAGIEPVPEPSAVAYAAQIPREFAAGAARSVAQIPIDMYRTFTSDDNEYRDLMAEADKYASQIAGRPTITRGNINAMQSFPETAGAIASLMNPLVFGGSFLAGMSSAGTRGVQMAAYNAATGVPVDESLRQITDEVLAPQLINAIMIKLGPAVGGRFRALLPRVEGKLGNALYDALAHGGGFVAVSQGLQNIDRIVKGEDPSVDIGQALGEFVMGGYMGARGGAEARRRYNEGVMSGEVNLIEKSEARQFGYRPPENWKEVSGRDGRTYYARPRGEVEAFAQSRGQQEAVRGTGTPITAPELRTELYARLDDKSLAELRDGYVARGEVVPRSIGIEMTRRAFQSWKQEQGIADTVHGEVVSALDQAEVTAVERRQRGEVDRQAKYEIENAEMLKGVDRVREQIAQGVARAEVQPDVLEIVDRTRRQIQSGVDAAEAEQRQRAGVDAEARRAMAENVRPTMVADERGQVVRPSESTVLARTETTSAPVAPTERTETTPAQTAPPTPITTPDRGMLQPSAKEPWQMTRMEYNRSELSKASQGEQRIWSDSGAWRADAEHGRFIRQALADGKPVPAEVLADYPGLQAPAPRAQTAAAPAREAAPLDLNDDAAIAAEHAKLREAIDAQQAIDLAKTKAERDRLNDIRKRREGEAGFIMNPVDMIMTLGERVYRAGARVYRTFSNKMREIAGSLWNHVAPHVKAAFEYARKAAEELNPAVGMAGRIATGEAVMPEESDIERRMREVSGRTPTQKPAAPTPEPKKPRARPDLAIPSADKAVRDLFDVVDTERNLQGKPEHIRQTAVREAAQRLVSSDPKKAITDLQAVHSQGRAFGVAENAVAEAIINRPETLAALGNGDPVARQHIIDMGKMVREQGAMQGRAFAIRRDLTLSPAERTRKFIVESLTAPMQQWFRSVGKELTPKQLANLTERLKSNGIDIGNLNDAILSDPIQAQRIIRTIQQVRADKWDAAYEYWINSILSGPTTHVANITGNTVNTIIEMTAQRLIEATMNLAIRNPKATQFGEFREMARVISPALKFAMNNAAMTWRLQAPYLERLITGDPAGVTKLEHGQAIEGRLGDVVRTPTRALVVADEFFKANIAQMQVTAEAYRIGKAKGLTGESLSNFINEQAGNLRSESWANAFDYAKELTFQAPVGKPTRALQSMVRAIPGGRYFIPFIPTLVNIFKRSGIIMPGVGQAIIAVKRIGGAYGEEGLASNKAIRDISSSVIGLGMMAMLYPLVSGDDDGIPVITGTRGTAAGSFGEMQLEQRTMPPMSIRIGDTIYGYGRFEPIANSIATSVDILRAIQGKEATPEVFDRFANLVQDKLFMQTISDIIMAIRGQKKPETMIANFAASWVPNFVRGITRSADDVYREDRVWGADQQAVAERAVRVAGSKSIPSSGLSYPKVDLWGREVTKHQGMNPVTDFMWNLTMPINVRNAVADPIDVMLLRYNRTAETPYAPRLPDPWYGPSDARHYMTEQQYHDYLVRSGTLAHERLMKAGLHFDNPREIDITMVGNIIEAARKQVKQEMFKYPPASVVTPTSPASTTPRPSASFVPPRLKSIALNRRELK